MVPGITLHLGFVCFLGLQIHPIIEIKSFQFPEINFADNIINFAIDISKETIYIRYTFGASFSALVCPDLTRLLQMQSRTLRYESIKHI
jgi:hypothetical protein